MRNPPVVRGGQIINQKSNEVITNKTSLTTQPGGLASRGLQIANKLAEQNAKTVKQSVEEPYFTNSLGMKFRLIPAGTFIMGSPETEEDRWDDENQHEVTISNAFWIGVHQVTQKQYEKVIGTNPSEFVGSKIQGDSSNHPVEQVSWEDTLEFCKKLSELPEEKKAGRVYRLPTEAEWEYACRAGTKTAYYFGENLKSLKDYAWFSGNSKGQTHPVGKKKPNNWGLHDMYGNVWEWCSDWFDEYPVGSVTDPLGPIAGSRRVVRGGNWSDGKLYCRSASRSGDGQLDRGDFLGFRIALSLFGPPRSLVRADTQIQTILKVRST